MADLTNSKAPHPPLTDPLADQWSVRPYPSELDHEVVTEEGLRFRVRPIRPKDAQLLVRFHAGLQPDSIYRRYFSLHPELSVSEVRRLTQVDYVERLAFVVENDGDLVGVGRFDRIPFTTRAEVAFIVADGYQHIGIGHLLLDQLAGEAWSLGITEFTAETQADNRSMMGVFTSSGFVVHSTLEDEVITAHFSIKPTEESQTGRERRERRFHVLPRCVDPQR